MYVEKKARMWVMKIDRQGSERVIRRGLFPKDTKLTIYDQLPSLIVSGDQGDTVSTDEP